MLIVLAHNTTGTKGDGTSDYDVELRINDRTFAKLQVKGHIRTAGAAVLLRKVADRLDIAENKTRYSHADELEGHLD